MTWNENDRWKDNRARHAVPLFMSALRLNYFAYREKRGDFQLVALSFKGRYRIIA